MRTGKRLPEAEEKSKSTPEIMNYRVASRAVSQSATPKNDAASPAFYIFSKGRKRGKLRGISIPRKRDKSIG